MDKAQRFRNTGMVTFFFSGICAISSGIIVSLLQERGGFSYGVTGSLLSVMSIGNMLAAFLGGVLPRKWGQRLTVLTMCTGYFLGYLLTAFASWSGLLVIAFSMIGLAKGCALNQCTVLVGTNSANKTKAMQLMHSCYACGALLCPFLIAGLGKLGDRTPMIGVALCGATLWLIFAWARLPGAAGETKKTEGKASREFLHSPTFWLLAALVFCQIAAETSVTGWLVTYYRQQGILEGFYSAYTMTVMWGATLIARLLIAFVLPIRNNYKALFIMGVCCTALYAVLMNMHVPVQAILVLFAFAFAMAGVNPMCTGAMGNQMSGESMGVLLSISALGGILMPLLIGLVADRAGLNVGMSINLIPCAGIAVISAILWARQRRS